MKIIKSFIIVFFSLMLASCSVLQQDNDLYNKNTNSKISLINLSEIYDGLEDGVNKCYTKISIPETINRQEPEKLYRISMKYQNSSKDLKFIKQRSEGLNETICKRNNLHKKSLILSSNKLDYISKEELGEYFLDCFVFGEFNFINEKMYNDYFEDSSCKLVKSYYLNRDKSNINDTYKLNNDNMTIKEIAKYTESFVNDELDVLTNGIKAQVRDIYIYKSNGRYAASCKLQLQLDNIPFMECDTLEYELMSDKTTDFVSSYITLKMIDKNNFAEIISNDCLEVNNKKEIEKIISLKKALDILEQELADNVHFDINDVCLEYCCKQKLETNDEVANNLNLDNINSHETFEYSPYWCFYIDDNEKEDIDNEHPRKSLLVNALTGELYVLV